MILDVSCPAQEYGIAGYTLLMSLIEYKTLVMRDDFEGANAILPTIPQVCAIMLQYVHAFNGGGCCRHRRHSLALSRLDSVSPPNV